MSLEGDLMALRGTVASLQQELGTELHSQFSESEQVTIMSLHASLITHDATSSPHLFLISIFEYLEAHKRRI